MKKIICYCLLSVLIAGLCLSFNGCASLTTPVIQVRQGVTAAPGERVSVDILIKHNPGIAGAKIKISYDAELTLVDASVGEKFSELDYTKPGKYTSPCNFTWDSLDSEVSADGTLLTLVFDVAEHCNSGDNINITLSYREGDIYDKELKDIKFEVQSGVITIR